MSIDDKAYELRILKKVVNRHIDESVPLTEDGLNILIHQSDELVWEVAKKIYTQSGYKVEFSIIRDVIMSRIEPLKAYLEAKKIEEQQHLAALKTEAERRRIEEEQRRAIQRAEEERRRVAFIAAQEAAEEKRRAEEEAFRKEYIAPLVKQLEDSGRDKSMAVLFSEIRDVVIEQLKVDSSDVTLDSSIANDLGADELNILALVMAFEEEFDIEIPDCDSETLSRVGDFVDYIYQQIQLEK